MIKIFHRFRSTNDLLDGHNELENQEIYFASPKELNDPMEGFKDVYWHGDEIAWKNLMKHYLLCLEHVCSLFIIGGKDIALGTKDIPVFKTEEQLSTPQYKNLYREICDRFFKNDLLDKYVKNLAGRSTLIRRDEFLMHVRILHNFALDTIFSVYESYNFITKRLDSEASHQMDKKALLDSDTLFNAINKSKAEHSDNEDKIDVIFSIATHADSQIRLMIRYDSPMHDDKNKDFVFLDFSEGYIQKIEKLIYPDWYTASFMAECNNSSVWGHYGDEHRGVCLSFKAAAENNNSFINLPGITAWNNSGPTYGKIKHIFYKIDYEKKYVEVDFFRSLGNLLRPVLTKFWYTNDSGSKSACTDVFDSVEDWRKKYWANFYQGITTKLKDWGYEKEYRLILDSFFMDLSNPMSRKLKYDFDDLESITFGIKTSTKDKLKIMKIIEAKCRRENRRDFKFYQAYYSERKGSIERMEMSLLKFKFEDENAI